MPFVRRFARSTLLALVVGSALATAHAIYPPGADAPGPSSLWAAVREFPQTLALLLPLAVFAGGVSASFGSDPYAADARRQQLLVVCGSAVVAFAFAGFVAPWIAKTLSHLGAPASPTSASQTVFEWGVAYRDLLAKRASGFNSGVERCGRQLCATRTPLEFTQRPGRHSSRVGVGSVDWCGFAGQKSATSFGD